MTNATNIPAHGVNDTRLSDLKKMVTKFGGEAALGKDAMPKLAMATIRAAADDVITADDAGDLYALYVKAENSKLIHEQAKGSQKVQVSKLRQIISMGLMRTIDPVAVLQTAYDVREELKAESATGVKPAYAFYVDVAREQLKQETQLDRAEIRELAFRGGPAERTVQQELEAIAKKLEGLISGENRQGLKDDSQAVIDAYDAIKTRIATLTFEAQKLHLMQEAAKLGLVVQA